MEQTSEINTFVGHLFRHHSGKMAAVLVRHFGVANIDTIEDAIQDAMITAMKRWSFAGIPQNPTAWLTKVAKNAVIDRLRRDRRSVAIDEFEFAGEDIPTPQFAGEIDDDQLRLIFSCCHPSISPDSQVALTLKIVCGFSVGEIARAFLSNDGSVAKLITRAKSRLRSGEIAFEIPVGDELSARMTPVLKVLYLMFNEGYTPTAGSEVVRRDLCYEALRLAEHITRNSKTSLPKSHALAALFCFHAARFTARIGMDGEMLLLANQDRTAWDRGLLHRGIKHLTASASGGELSDYHLEAEIASVHSLASSVEATDWRRIVDCYDLLQRRSFSPIAELNRVIAIGQIDGSERAFELLESLANDEKLAGYYLFHAARAHYLALLGNFADALTFYEKARSLSYNETTRRLITIKIDELRGA